MVAPVIASSTSATTGGIASGTISLAMPTGLAAGDLILVLFAVEEDNFNPITAPSGYSIHTHSDNDEDIQGAVFYRVATGGETWPLVVDCGSSDYAVGWCLRITGADPVNPVHTLGIWGGESFTGSSVQAQGVNAGTNDALVVAFAASDGADATPDSLSNTTWWFNALETLEDPAGFNGGVGAAYTWRQLPVGGSDYFGRNITFNLRDGQVDGRIAVQVSIAAQQPVIITPSGIPAPEPGIGSPTIQPGAVSVQPTGVASAEAVGSLAVQPGAVSVQPGGIASVEAFGAPTVDIGAVTLQPAGVASLEAFGSVTIAVGAVSLQPSGIDSAEAFGPVTVQPGAVTLQPGGIASAEALGEPLIELSGATLQPAGIASAESFGALLLQPGGITVQVDGVPSVEAFGAARVELTVGPSAIASAEAFGSLTVEIAAYPINPASIETAEAFGQPTIDLGAVTVTVGGIDSREAFGAFDLVPGAVALAPAGIASLEAFGVLVANAELRVFMNSLWAEERTIRFSGDSRTVTRGSAPRNVRVSVGNG